MWLPSQKSARTPQSGCTDPVSPHLPPASLQGSPLAGPSQEPGILLITKYKSASQDTREAQKVPSGWREDGDKGKRKTPAEH